MSLSAFLDCFCGRRWQAFKDAWLPMQPLRYFPPQDSFSTRPDSKALVVCLLTFWYRLRCLKCHQTHTPCHCQPRTQNPAVYHLLAPFLWYLVLVIIHERRRKSSTSWAIQTYKLVCLLGVILEKGRETWLLTCNSARFWGICYSAKPSHLVHSFGAWLPYCDPVFKAFVHGRGFIGKQSSTLGARRIVLLWFLTISGDWSLLCMKPKDDIRSWARKACSRC